MSNVESPNTSPKGRKLSKKLLSFSVKKTPKVETPAHRFMVSCQGHGYPVPLPATQAAAATPAAASAKTGLMNLLKRDHHAKTPAKATPTAPAYRFISSMAGYGCPYPTDATPLPKAPKAEKSVGISLPAFVGELTHALKKEKTVAAVPPAHRFMVSCQGHGYPVPESTVSPASPAPRRKTASTLLGMLKREPTVGSKPAPALAPVTVAEAAPAVPAYRFISTMAGNGCPMPTDATPLVAAHKHHHAKSAMGGILGGISSVFKRSSPPHTPVAEEATAAPVAEAPEAAPVAEVPAYRFIVSMQGHGYPVPQSTAAAPVGSPKKKAKKGFLSSIFSIFSSKPKAQSAAVGQA